MTDLLSMDQKDMEAFVVENGFPKFRSKQLYQWIHEKEIFSFDEMRNLPKEFRQFLKDNAELCRGRKVAESVSADGETVKFLLQFHNDPIETVLMRYNRKSARDRNTLCISTQVGCAMGCKFCATGQGGLKRNLSVGEILDQVNFANAYLREKGEPPVSNVVYMGMGEPLANYDALLKSLHILNDAKNIGMRRISVSTCGLIPEIEKLMQENLQFTLAVSLHSAKPDVRSEIMPINKKYPLFKLMPVLDRYIEETGRRITIEYALFKGVNDGESDAHALAELLKHKLYHVNIVPGNPVEGTDLHEPEKEQILRFVSVLEKAGVPVSVRESKGRDIDGACGQLRAKYQKLKQD